MTTSTQTTFSAMSRLTIDEVTTQNESNAQSGNEIEQSVVTRSESNFTDEIKASLCVEMADQDNGIVDTHGRPDESVDNVREMAYDQREDGIMAETSCKAREGDNIHVNENRGTLIIDLASQLRDPSTRGCGAEMKTLQSDDFPRTNTCIMNHFAQSSAKPLQVISSSEGNPLDFEYQFERKNVKRLLRQSKITFRQRKRRTNLKSVARQKPLVEYNEKHDEAGDATVNINVVNNTGSIIIGNVDISYYDGLGPDRTDSDQLTGGLVVADGGMVVPSPQRGPVFYIDRNTTKWLKKFYRITNAIYPLRDNGQWDVFYETVGRGIVSANRNGLSEVEIFLMIEKSTALSYQGKNDESKTIVKQAKDMILRSPSLNMRQFLTTLSHCQLAALYRRDSKLDKSNNALSIAEHNVEGLPSELARAYVIYEKASIWYIEHTRGLCKSKQDKDKCAEMAKAEFKNCIHMCEKMLSSEKDIYLRRHHFCYVKLALLNLDCVTTEARNQPVSEACISEASDCIAKMQQQYSRGEIVESAAILLFAAETGHFYRLGDYASAEICARRALHKAESLGFRLEVEELQDSLKDMSLLKQEQQK